MMPDEATWGKMQEVLREVENVDGVEYLDQKIMNNSSF
jgi:hypothetical protein